MSSPALIVELDPRAQGTSSIVEATSTDDDGQLVSDDVELKEWRPIRPEQPEPFKRLAFVDGVQRTHARVGVRTEASGWPAPGAIASYGAGFLVHDGVWDLQAAEIRHALIVGPKMHAAAESITIQTGGGEYAFAPRAAKDDEPLSIQSTLMQLRQDLEVEVTHGALARFADTIVVDGRLPPAMPEHVIGLIKTPARMGLAEPDRLHVVASLQVGERSPIYEWRRSDRIYFRCFVCLRTPRTFELTGSGVALLEFSHQMPIETAAGLASQLAANLPPFATTAARDARAPQNLMPVAYLERKLGHLMGESSFIRAKLLRAL